MGCSRHARHLSKSIRVPILYYLDSCAFCMFANICTYVFCSTCLCIANIDGANLHWQFCANSARHWAPTTILREWRYSYLRHIAVAFTWKKTSAVGGRGWTTTTKKKKIIVNIASYDEMKVRVCGERVNATPNSWNNISSISFRNYKFFPNSSSCVVLVPSLYYSLRLNLLAH